MPGLVCTKMVRDLDEFSGTNFDKMMRVADIAQTVRYVLNCSQYCCPTQILIRPQKDPFKSKL